MAIGQMHIRTVVCNMLTRPHRHLIAELSSDLNKSSAKPSIEVVDDPGRKTFNANKNGAILEFPYKQTDVHYWNGVKHYGSGMRSNIRLPRTQSEAAPAKASSSALLKVKAKRVVLPPKL